MFLILNLKCCKTNMAFNMNFLYSQIKLIFNILWEPVRKKNRWNSHKLQTEIRYLYGLGLVYKMKWLTTSGVL